MTGRRRTSGSHHGSTGSSHGTTGSQHRDTTPTRRRDTDSQRRDGGDSPARRQGGTGSGVGADLDTLDRMSGRLDATRGKVEGVGETVRGVNVGPRTMGLIGSGFAGSAEAHLRAADAHVTRTTRAVEQAQAGTRGTTRAYRDTDAINAANLNKIDTTSKPVATHNQPTPASHATPPPSKPKSISDILNPPDKQPPRRPTATPPPRKPRDYSGDAGYRSSDADRAAFRRDYPNYDDHAAAVGDLQAKHPELRGIPEEDLVAIRGYTTDDFYRGVNLGMRNDDPAELARYDSHIRTISSGLNQLPPYDGPVGRGITITDPAVLNDVINRYEPGKVVEERAFISTDTSKSFSGNVQFEINSRTGHDIKDLSVYHKTESEVLFGPGSKFRVLSRTFDPATNTWHIVMDDVS